MRRTHIDLLIEWRRTFRTIASGRGKRTQGSSRSIDRSNHHDEESPTTCTSVFRLPTPIDESCAVPILIGSSNGAALFGRSHQGGDNAHGPIDRTRPMTRNGLTNDHCGNHDEDEDEDRDAMTTINAIYGPKESPAPACPTACPNELVRAAPIRVVQQGRGIFGRRDTPKD
jgi:hypothetical protein